MIHIRKSHKIDYGTCVCSTKLVLLFRARFRGVNAVLDVFVNPCSRLRRADRCYVDRQAVRVLRVKDSDCPAAAARRFRIDRLETVTSSWRHHATNQFGLFAKQAHRHEVSASSIRRIFHLLVGREAPRVSLDAGVREDEVGGGRTKCCHGVQHSLTDLGGLLPDGIRQCAATVIGKQCQYRIVDPVIVDDLAGSAVTSSRAIVSLPTPGKPSSRTNTF